MVAFGTGQLDGNMRTDVGNLSMQNIGNRAAIAANCVDIAIALRAIGIAYTTSYEFERVDFAMRAIPERNSQGDPIEPRLSGLN
jgi:hypothetical protein